MTKEELEKEAEEYARDTYEMCSYQGLPYASDRRAREQAYIAAAEPREKRIAELEKENAELENRNLELLQSCEGATMMYKQLTKAKEILKAVVDFYPTTTTTILCEAEQFLKVLKGCEVEK